VKKDHLVFLLAGLAFGFLLGFGAFRAWQNAPGQERAGDASGAGPRGPMAPTQVGGQNAGPSGGGGGPMVAEINALKERLQRDPKDAAALVRLANLHHDVGMWPQAASYYERALQITADDPDLLTDLGICYRGMQRFEDALAKFERASTVAPKHWQSLYNIVIVEAFDLRRFDRAEAALTRLEAFDPPPPNLAELQRRVDQAKASGS
jgi:tetratricopeptide (TPR) repeat protein